VSLKVDPTYEFILTDSDRWSPLALATKWEHALGISDHFRSRFINPLTISEERHIALVHSMDYHLNDDRALRIVVDGDGLATALAQFKSTNMTTVWRVLYIPNRVVGDFSEAFSTGATRSGVSGLYMPDVAIYEDLDCKTFTLACGPLSAEQIAKSMVRGMDGVVLMSYQHYEWFESDGDSDAQYFAGKLYVLFQPGLVDMIAKLRTISSAQYVKCEGFVHKGNALPGLIGIEGVSPTGARFFCLADRFLMKTYCEVLHRVASFRDLAIDEEWEYRRCAIEACYGITSNVGRARRGAAPWAETNS
jgi:hypothetical protein